MTLEELLNLALNIGEVSFERKTEITIVSIRAEKKSKGRAWLNDSIEENFASELHQLILEFNT